MKVAASLSLTSKTVTAVIDFPSKSSTESLQSTPGLVSHLSLPDEQKYGSSNTQNTNSHINSKVQDAVLAKQLESKGRTVKRFLDWKAQKMFPPPVHELGSKVSNVSPMFTASSPASTAHMGPFRPEGKLLSIQDTGTRQILTTKTGTLIAHFSEHTGAVNQLKAAPDHAFFISASDDGTVKVWDTQRLERNVTNRSRVTYNHNSTSFCHYNYSSRSILFCATESKVRCVTFAQNTHTVASGAADGSIHVWRLVYDASHA